MNRLRTTGGFNVRPHSRGIALPHPQGKASVQVRPWVLPAAALRFCAPTVVCSCVQEDTLALSRVGSQGCPGGASFPAPGWRDAGQGSRTQEGRGLTAPKDALLPSGTPDRGSVGKPPTHPWPRGGRNQVAADPCPALCTLTPPICAPATGDCWGAGGLTCQEQWCLRSLGVSQC